MLFGSSPAHEVASVQSRKTVNKSKQRIPFLTAARRLNKQIFRRKRAITLM
jgi:hypothetical protein